MPGRAGAGAVSTLFGVASELRCSRGRTDDHQLKHRLRQRVAVLIGQIDEPHPKPVPTACVDRFTAEPRLSDSWKVHVQTKAPTGRRSDSQRLHQTATDAEVRQLRVASDVSLMPARLQRSAHAWVLTQLSVAPARKVLAVAQPVIKRHHSCRAPVSAGSVAICDTADSVTSPSQVHGVCQRTLW